MTARDLYEAALIEINKLEAPSMLLEDYNYFINKAIQQYINKAYNRYEINQQATDDLRVLKTSVSLYVNTYKNSSVPNEDHYYFAILPPNYMHMLGCVVKFDTTGSSSRCEQGVDYTRDAYVARKLTSDIYPSIINNAYFKPSYRTPYYSIDYVSKETAILEQIIDPCNEIITRPGDVIDQIMDPCDKEDKDIPWEGGYVLNLRCGNDPKYIPTLLYVDYIKTPAIVELKDGDITSSYDNTAKMEFPDYVCYEIINEFVKLLLENTSDPRLQTNIPINQTISQISE